MGCGLDGRKSVSLFRISSLEHGYGAEPSVEVDRLRTEQTAGAAP